MRRGLAFTLLVACRPPECSPRWSLLRPLRRPRGDGDDDPARPGAAAPADHDDHDHSTTTTTTTPRPSTIAAGVTVGGEVLVGGLSPADATAAVKAFFARPLVLRPRQGDPECDTEELGASAYVAMR